MMVDRDWNTDPTYESDRIRIDASMPPLVFYDMKLPRQVTDDEIALMLSLAESRLKRGLPMVGFVRHTRGTGVISARHRKTFTEWLEAHADALDRDDFGVTIVLPEAIFRAVLRVVYRFRTPPLRTLTAPDVATGLDTVRAELARIGRPATPAMDAYLDALAT